MVAVVALAPLLGTFHRASVGHAVCEHGDLIEPAHGLGHASQAAGIRFDEPGPGDAASNRGLQLREDSSSASHDHAHCQVGTLAKAGVGMLSSTSLFARLLRAGAPAFHGSGDISLHRCVLASAPKTSPPSLSAIVFA
jgi:hypothetical protein